MQIEPYQELESRIGDWIHNPNVVACSSGTSALHLAIESLELPLGSEIILPDFTMVACARAVVMSGMLPVFVDCLDTLLLDISKIESLINKNTKAIMAVHIYGRACDMEAIHRIARSHNLYVIEDLAEIHGVNPHTETDAACWSFYRNKIVCGEEGGAVAFRDSTHTRVAKQLRSLGFTEAHDFEHIPRGHNYRMSNLHARVILPSLAAVEFNLQRRKAVEILYNSLVPEEWHMPSRQSVWVYDLRIPNIDQYQQTTLVRELNGKGIPARHAFKPMTTQDEFRGRQEVSPNALRLSQEIIYLPVAPTMLREDIVQIVRDLKEVVSRVL